MNPILKNVIALLLGWFIGAGVNMGLIYLGPQIIPPPANLDMTTLEGLKAGIPLLEFKHFVFPFLAHALGSLTGAFFAAKIAANRTRVLAMVIGIIFMLGGISMARMVPQPTWFTLADLLLAYIPMAFIGWKLSGNRA